MKQIKLTSDQLGRLGETAVALELMKRGYDVINLNESFKNYTYADLLCISKDKKETFIQVKTGSTNLILSGLKGNNKGEIVDLYEKVVCPWVFVHVTPNADNYFNFDFYILTRDEIRELLESSHRWYANDTKNGRILKKDTLVGVTLSWLEAGTTKATKLLNEYKSTLKSSSKNQWNKIFL